MTEAKARKNPDYSGSAVKLTNPGPVKSLLEALRSDQVKLQSLRVKADSFIPAELKAEIDTMAKSISELDGTIRTAVDDFGSYQDVEVGAYAVKVRRESIIYKPELVRQYAPSKVASFVIIESVDSKALDALVKAGQVTPEQAKNCGEVKESFAYIIK